MSMYVSLGTDVYIDTHTYTHTVYTMQNGSQE